MDPQEAAKSLVSLLEEAEKVIPVELREQTPVRVGVGGGHSISLYGMEAEKHIFLTFHNIFFL
jgi:hypothetical protein